MRKQKSAKSSQRGLYLCSDRKALLTQISTRPHPNPPPAAPMHSVSLHPLTVKSVTRTPSCTTPLPSHPLYVAVAIVQLV